MRLAVGRIVKPHGIRGEVAVELYSDFPERFAPGERLQARDGVFTVQSARTHQGRLLVRFEGILDRNDAEALRDLELTIDEAEALPLPEWSFYPHQLEGCEVFEVSGARRGTVARVEEGRANDLWVIKTPRGEVYLPAVRALITSVDIAARRITVDPPEGLFE